MSPSLIPCSVCARHILTTEQACPFCGNTEQGARTTAGRPLFGAAILLAGMTAVTACGKTTVSSDGDAARVEPRPEDIRAVPAYGGPPPQLFDAAPPAPPTVTPAPDAGGGAKK
jgi:hypothetical protein